MLTKRIGDREGASEACVVLLLLLLLLMMMMMMMMMMMAYAGDTVHIQQATNCLEGLVHQRAAAAMQALAEEWCGCSSTAAAAAVGWHCSSLFAAPGKLACALQGCVSLPASKPSWNSSSGGSSSSSSFAPLARLSAAE
jgi:hypothetical protein